MTQKTITVFGSSRLAREDERYARIMRAGRLLAEAGFAVCSGGYAGAMEAISRGAREAGGHTIGITLASFGPEPANEWVVEEIRMDSFIGRTDALIQAGDGYLVVDGGIGTLTELTMTWSLLQIGALEGRPCVLLGEAWREMVHTMRQHLIIRERDFCHLLLANSAEEASSLLFERLRPEGLAR